MEEDVHTKLRIIEPRGVLKWQVAKLRPGQAPKKRLFGNVFVQMAVLTHWQIPHKKDTNHFIVVKFFCEFYCSQNYT